MHRYWKMLFPYIVWCEKTTRFAFFFTEWEGANPVQLNASPAMSDETLMKHIQRGTLADEGVPEIQGSSSVERPVWVKVDPDQPLGDILSLSGHVIPCQPVFHVLAKDTDFHRRFKAGQWTPP